MYRLTIYTSVSQNSPFLNFSTNVNGTEKSKYFSNLYQKRKEGFKVHIKRLNRIFRRINSIKKFRRKFFSPCNLTGTSQRVLTAKRLTFQKPVIKIVKSLGLAQKRGEKLASIQQVQVVEFS